MVENLLGQLLLFACGRRQSSASKMARLIRARVKSPVSLCEKFLPHRFPEDLRSRSSSLGVTTIRREEKLRGNDSVYRIIRNPDEQVYRICAISNDKRCVRDPRPEGALFRFRSRRNREGCYNIIFMGINMRFVMIMKFLEISIYDREIND